MKKTGKYERKPKTGDLLLQTYFTSMVSLILCVSMFFGTSYAWFTSEVTNNANEIYVGTLKVGLYKVENGKTVDLATSENNNAKLFNSAIRWEPGYTALETIQITNEGDLAFKYVMNFTDGSGVKGDTALTAEELASIADMFEVYVFNHYKKQYSTPESYGALVSDSNWKPVGSLKDVLEGAIVLDGNMVTVRQDDKDDDPTTPNETVDGVKTVDTYTIALHMKESATEGVMGRKISLNVKLVAYQKAEEQDTFENNPYDEINVASDAKQLQTKLNNSESVVLVSDIEPMGEINDVSMKTGTLDGNGKRVSIGINTTADSNVTINNVIFEGDFSPAGSVTMSGCTFNGVVSPSGTMILTGCSFATEGLDVSNLKDGTVELINCTYNGVLVESAVLVADNTGLTNSSTVIVVDSNQMVVLNANN